MKTFAKNGILAAAQALGVTPNVLGARLGYTDGPAAPGMTEAEAKFLLCPFALCHIAQRFPDETVFFTSALSRASGCAFSGEQGESVTLGAAMPFDEAAAKLLKTHLGGNEPAATGVNLPLNAMQAAVLLTLADALRRRRLSCLLTGRIADLNFTLDDLRREMDFAASEKDPRWLLPFLQNAAGETLLDDSTLPAALASFGDSPLLSVPRDGKIALTQSGARLVDALSRTDAFLSAASVFYVSDAQNVMAALLLGGGGCEFYLELSAEGFLCTCDDDGALAALATLLAPGDVPDFDLPDEAPQAPANEPASVPRSAPKPEPRPAKTNAPTPPAEGWRCACGNVNTGRFCAGCGKPKPVATAFDAPVRDESWQCACGSVNKGDFCPKCGAKRSYAPTAPADGSWDCSCGRTNKGGFCPNCGVKRPQ